MKGRVLWPGLGMALFLALTLVAGCQEGGGGGGGNATSHAIHLTPPLEGLSLTFREGGLTAPVGVLYDPELDHYIVLNAGDPGAGAYLSLLSPSGEAIVSRWVEVGGGSIQDEASLQAPMGLLGDTLFLPVGGCLRRFDRRGGALLGEGCLPEGRRIRGFSVSPDGWRFLVVEGEGGGELLVERPGGEGWEALPPELLPFPVAGVLSGGRGVATLSGATDPAVLRIEFRGEGWIGPFELWSLRGAAPGSFSRMEDGALLLSSRADGTFLRLGMDGTVRSLPPLPPGVIQLGVDGSRGVLTLPHPDADAIELRPLP